LFSLRVVLFLAQKTWLAIQTGGRKNAKGLAIWGSRDFLASKVNESRELLTLLTFHVQRQA
jgi:hypothetical protein